MNVMKLVETVGGMALEGAVDLTAMSVMHSLCPVKGAMNAEKALLTVGKLGISHTIADQVTRQIKRDLRGLTKPRHHEKVAETEKKVK